MPDKERDITKPLDVTKEVMVAHHARLFTLPQFAVLAAELLKARGEPTPMLYGWAGSVLPIDQAASQDCFFDLIHFARRQWHEQYHNVKGEEYSFEETATAISDRIFQQAVECWKCSQYGHKSFERQGRWTRSYGWGWQAGYSSRSRGQAYHSNWREGYIKAEDGVMSGADRLHRALLLPPEPAQPPRGPAPADHSAAPEVVTSTAETPAAAADPVVTKVPQQELRTARIRSEEYCEIDGMPHYKRTFTDGTVEYEPW